MSGQAIHLPELLEWYVEAGVDCAMGDGPVDRFAEHAEAKATPAQAVPVAAPAMRAVATPKPAAAAPARVVPTGEVAERARAVAQAATTLDALEEALRSFEGCNLKATARSTVFADGNPEAPLMIVGEAPGRDEDEQGKPFVGRSGQLLDRMLASIGLDRTSVYITNVVAWRPPGNRTPTAPEIAICKPFVDRHIELAAPRMLMLVGGSAAKAMLNTPKGIMSLRGRFQDVEIDGNRLPAMSTLHPAYLLRQPAHKRLAWNDLLLVQDRLKALTGND